MRTILLLILVILLPDYSLFGQNKNIGVLVLAHGGSEEWNSLIDDAVSPVKQSYSTAIAYGMANPRTLEKGIRELESSGVSKVVVVPLFISSHSFIIRQTEYFLGLRDSLADPLLIMDHSSHHGHGQMSHDAKPAQIRTNLEITMAAALDDHDIVARILNERIRSLSKSPESETIIIVAHGPNPEKDNKEWVSVMENLTDKIRHLNTLEETTYKNIYSLTVRDDSDEDIYQLAAENLRSIVRQSSKNSNVIVVPLLLSKGGVEKGIVKRLSGLDYKWSGETLLPDPLITEFISQSIESSLKKSY